MELGGGGGSAAQGKAARALRIEIANPSRSAKWGWGLFGGGVVLGLLSALSFALLGLGAAWVWLLLPAVLLLLAGIWQVGGAEKGPGERRLLPGSARVEGDDIVFLQAGTTLRYPKHQIHGGWLEPFGSCVAVLRLNDGSTLAAGFPTDADAQAFLDDAGAGASRSAVRMPVYRETTAGRRTAGIVTFVLLLLVLSAGLGLLAAAFAVLLSAGPEAFLLVLISLTGIGPFCVPLWWFGTKLWPSWVDIGTDGVLVRGLMHKRFVPHTDIRKIQVTHRVYYYVVLTLANGREMKIPTANHAAAEALMERIASVRRLAPAKERTALIRAVLRSGRSVSDWARALRGLLEEHDYRSAAHGVADLLAVVEDPTAPPEQRVAAAAAIQHHADGSTRQRLRVAAEACVRPRVRVALEQAAAGGMGEAELELACAPDEAESGDKFLER